MRDNISLINVSLLIFRIAFIGSVASAVINFLAMTHKSVYYVAIVSIVLIILEIYNWAKTTTLDDEIEKALKE